MERDEIERELAMAGAQELLASTSAHLAYVAGDGTPRVMPVGVFWTGDEFVVSTATTAPKVAALAARPDVALALEAGDTPGGARSLSVRGRATVEIVDGVVPEYLAAARRTMAADAADEFEKNVRRSTTRWRASRSRQPGCASTTSVPAGCPGSCRNSQRRIR